MKREISGKGASLSACRACKGCGELLALANIFRTVGKDVIIVGATGCAEVFSTPYPETAWPVPYIHVAFENAGAVASGVAAALKKLGKKTKVVVIAGDGGTYDIGFQALSGAIERDTDFLYICFNNEAYMNTGVQRSGATPKHSWTTTTPYGKRMFRKPMPLIVASHQNVYVATANTSYVDDFISKIKKGLEFNGPAYIDLLCPCVPGWKIKPEESIDVAKKAFLSKVTPLYEIEDGKLRFTMKPDKIISVKDYLMMQGRFKHLDEKEINEIQERVDKELERLEELEKSNFRF